jgi:16S rRNA (uracil1498-N3)-methyltransferase
MPRFPVDEKNIDGAKATLVDSDYRHAVKVLRMKEGDAITLFDGRSMEYEGRISHVGTRDILVDIVSSRKVETDSPLRYASPGAPQRGKDGLHRGEGHGGRRTYDSARNYG